jgi:hypothetical protein
MLQVKFFEDLASVTNSYNKRLAQSSQIEVQINKAIMNEMPMAAGRKGLFPILRFNSVKWYNRRV